MSTDTLVQVKKLDKSKRPFIFLSVGVFNTAVDFAFYTFLTSTAFRGGKHIALAGFISGTFALLCAFLAHGFITWHGSHLSHKTLLKFVLFTGFGMWVIRPILLDLFIKLQGLYGWAHHITTRVGLPFSHNFVANTGAFALMLLIVLTYNYFAYERFVFTKFKSNHTEPENHLES